MNLRNIDLNLLVVLDMLLDEAHVSRAADRLGMSQPAASNALERCRHLFDDPLLERRGSAMRRTAKGDALRRSLKNALAEMKAVLDPPEVALADIKQSVRLIMSDLPAAMVVPLLVARLQASAPGINLVIMPWHGADVALASLENGDADLAMSVFPAIGDAFHRRDLMFEDYRIVMRAGHPAAADFHLDAWLDYPHVIVSGHGFTRGPLDDTLDRLGRFRRVAVVVPSFQLVPPLLMASDLIAMLPRHCLPSDEAQAFVTFEPPIAIEGFPLHLAWHHRLHEDRAVQHVAGLIESIFSEAF